MQTGEPYYRRNLALVHDLGFGHHADACAPGVLDLLKPVLAFGGLVLEIGCGSGRLTRHMLAAGHDVIATDASPAMLDLTRERVPEAKLRQLTLPTDALPPADAIVGVGHALNYLPDEGAVRRAFASIAAALRPPGSPRARRVRPAVGCDPPTPTTAGASPGRVGSLHAVLAAST